MGCATSKPTTTRSQEAIQTTKMGCATLKPDPEPALRPSRSKSPIYDLGFYAGDMHDYRNAVPPSYSKGDTNVTTSKGNIRIEKSCK
ncbi:hypothetical protein HYFRA_00007443 [Hymenoscyphus fraxineus]|uniref:Uncharacterized protein n=1 Tax=Hymenoscyphus fraxineus TaxID=746836 RepID=A0A9N9KT42_9HELO|nr:hypothetical protein HYFRA_00007443 [Hymenoscyphus fraxineus]